MPMYDPFPLKSNPINEAIRTKGALEGMRIRKQDAEGRQQARAQDAKLRNMQIDQAERQQQRTDDLDTLRTYRQDVAALLQSGGGSLKLRDPSHASIFERYGLPTDGDAVEISGDEQSMFKALGAVSPTYGGLESQQVKEVAGAFRDLDFILQKAQSDPEAAAQLGIRPGKDGRVAITRESAPEVFASLETALGRQVRKGDGGDKALYGAYFDPETDRVAFEVEVTGKDGKRYTAPITVNRGTGDDDPVRLIPRQGFAGYVRANADLGRVLTQTMAELGDATAASDLERMRQQQSNERLGEALGEIAGFSDKEAGSLRKAVAAGADAKATAEMILKARPQEKEIEIAWRDDVKGKDGKPYQVAYDKNSGKELARVEQWVKGEGAGSGSGGGGKGGMKPSDYRATVKMAEERLQTEMINDFVQALPEEQRQNFIVENPMDPEGKQFKDTWKRVFSQLSPEQQEFYRSASFYAGEVIDKQSVQNPEHIVRLAKRYARNSDAARRGQGGESPQGAPKPDGGPGTETPAGITQRDIDNVPEGQVDMWYQGLKNAEAAGQEEAMGYLEELSQAHPAEYAALMRRINKERQPPAQQESPQRRGMASFKEQVNKEGLFPMAAKGMARYVKEAQEAPRFPGWR